MPSADDKPRRGGLERSLLYAGSFSFAANTWGRMSAGTFCPNKQKVLKRNVQNKQMKKWTLSISESSGQEHQMPRPLSQIHKNNIFLGVFMLL